MAVARGLYCLAVASATALGNPEEDVCRNLNDNILWQMQRDMRRSSADLEKYWAGNPPRVKGWMWHSDFYFHEPLAEAMRAKNSQHCVTYHKACSEVVRTYDDVWSSVLCAVDDKRRPTRAEIKRQTDWDAMLNSGAVEHCLEAAEALWEKHGKQH